MMKRYTPQIQEALGLTVGVAETLNHGYVGTEHLLISLSQEGTGVAAKVLEENGVEEDRVIELVSQLIVPNPTVQIVDKAAYTPKARCVIENSYRGAAHFKAAQTGTKHILIAMPREGDCAVSRFLNTIGVNAQKLCIDLLVATGEDAPAAKDDLQGARARKHGNAAPTLDSYSRNPTQLATAGKSGPITGRKQGIQRVIQILSRHTKNNPCLIGRPGVDKTAVVEGLIQMIASGDAPETIVNKGVVTLDLSGMVVSSEYRGKLEERIKKVISEVVESGDVLLFIDEIHTIIGAGGAEDALDTSNILKPSLARGEVQLIGATATNEYHKYIEKDPASERRFQPVTVDEPTEEESVTILKELRSRYEEHHKVEIADNALEATMKLSSRYIDDRFSPDKTIDLIGRAAPKVYPQNYTKPDKIKIYEAGINGLEEAKKKVIKKETYEKARETRKKQEKLRGKIAQTMEKWQKDRGSKEPIVSDNETADVVSGWTKASVRRLAEEESECLRNLGGILRRRVVGQEEAITAISEAIRRGRVGLKDSKRPISSFLFLGPTGVGRMELSKALSEAMFGIENTLIHMDMSERMEKHSISKMIGSPPGYVGYDEGGQLSEKARRNHYSVILSDEIEKAHPDVFNILLQALDDGHIADTQGRKIDPKNVIIIMTPNVEVKNIIPPRRLGLGMVSDIKTDYMFMKDRVVDEVRRPLKLEFLNRIDEIIMFHQFTGEYIKGAADIILGIISKCCKEQPGMGLEAMDNIKEHLIGKGYDDGYSARPLRRTTQSLVEDQMAEEMLDDSIKADSLAEVGFDGGKLTFTVKAETARPRAASKPAAVREGFEDKGEIMWGRNSAGRAIGRKEETRAPEA